MASKTKRKRPRTAAQRAATRKMIAANRARRAPRLSPRRRNPGPPVVAANPARPRRRTTSKRAASSAGRTLRYRRRNPNGVGGNLMSFVQQTLVPSAVGGGGALVVDMVMNMLPLPVQLKTGPMRTVTRVAGAVGVGMLATQFVGRRVGGQVAAGALTVVMYDFIKGFLAGRVPGIGVYDIPGVGQYEVTEPPEAIGYYDAGQQVDMPASVGEYVSDIEEGVYR